MAAIDQRFLIERRQRLCRLPCGQVLGLDVEAARFPAGRDEAATGTAAAFACLFAGATEFGAAWKEASVVTRAIPASLLGKPADADFPAAVVFHAGMVGTGDLGKWCPPIWCCRRAVN